MHWGLSLTGRSLGLLNLGVKVIDLFNLRIIFILSVVRLDWCLKCHNLCHSLISVIIYLIHSFNHSGQVFSFDAEIFFKFDINLLEYDPFAPQIINLVPYGLILSHCRAISLVGLVKSIFNYIDLLAQLSCSVLVRTWTSCRTLFSLLLDYFSLELLYFVINAFACHCFSFDLLNQLLNFLFFDICHFLRGILLLLLSAHLSLVHLKLFEEGVIFHVQSAHLFLLLLKLLLKGLVKCAHVIFNLFVLFDFVKIFGPSVLHLVLV